jgi:hypothetical protein
MIVCILFNFSINYFSKKEEFEVLIGDDHSHNESIKRVDIKDFFNFVEYHMINDMDPRIETNGAQWELCHVKGETIKISNNIRNLLEMLHFIVYVNNKDNFYNRFLVTKVGSNLMHKMRQPKRKMNYDEMVRNHIGQQYTFMKKSGLHEYAPKASIESEHQYPIPDSINIHNYYKTENIEVNLLALKILIDLVQEGNTSYFEQNIRPTEHIAFENEFMVPTRSLINSMLTIVNTEAYRKYNHNMLVKNPNKYKHRGFNPTMILL